MGYHYSDHYDTKCGLMLIKSFNWLRRALSFSLLAYCLSWYPLGMVASPEFPHAEIGPPDALAHLDWLIMSGMNDWDLPNPNLWPTSSFIPQPITTTRPSVRPLQTTMAAWVGPDGGCMGGVRRSFLLPSSLQPPPAWIMSSLAAPPKYSRQLWSWQLWLHGWRQEECLPNLSYVALPTWTAPGPLLK